MELKKVCVEYGENMLKVGVVLECLREPVKARQGLRDLLVGVNQLVERGNVTGGQLRSVSHLQTNWTVENTPLL